MLKHCDICGPGGCDVCDVCGPGGCVMFVMFVVQVGVVTEGGQVVVPFQRCQGQSTSLNASGQLTDGHAYVLLLKVLKCVCA